MIETRKGHIHRIVESMGMGYIAEPEKDRLWLFLFPQLVGYGGQYPEEIGLTEEVPVEFVLTDVILTSVSLEVPIKSLAQTNAN